MGCIDLSWDVLIYHGLYNDIATLILSYCKEYIHAVYDKTIWYHPGIITTYIASNNNIKRKKRPMHGGLPGYICKSMCQTEFRFEVWQTDYISDNLVVLMYDNNILINQITIDNFDRSDIFKKIIITEDEIYIIKEKPHKINYAIIYHRC
jgi:hypothetical protein